MMNSKKSFQRRGRALIQRDRDAVVHALGCANCGLRDEALVVLQLVGWTEQEFIDECFRQLLRSPRSVQ